VAILAVLAIGLYLSGKLERDSRLRVDEVRHGQVAASDILDDVAARRRNELYDAEIFAHAAREDAARFEVDGFDPKSLAAQQRHRVLIEDGVALGPGQSWSSGDVKVSVTAEKVEYRQHGAMVAARHLIAVITNVSERPLAYYARLRSLDRGLCEVRGARMHNAMALMPDEAAEVVVCAGPGKIRVDRLEILEVSELGYHYVSQVPPGAIGHDSVTSASHEPMSRAPICTSVDDKGLSTQVRKGLVRWVDVIDFYSRHNCERFAFFEGYRYGPEARQVPVPPPD
jgi:hypothetical protein